MAQTDFCVVDEDLGIIRIGMTERGSFKAYLEAVHIPLFKGCAKHKTAVNILRIYRSYAEST